MQLSSKPAEKTTIEEELLDELESLESELLSKQRGVAEIQKRIQEQKAAKIRNQSLQPPSFRTNAIIQESSFRRDAETVETTHIVDEPLERQRTTPTKKPFSEKKLSIAEIRSLVEKSDGKSQSAKSARSAAQSEWLKDKQSEITDTQLLNEYSYDKERMAQLWDQTKVTLENLNEVSAIIARLKDLTKKSLKESAEGVQEINNQILVFQDSITKAETEGKSDIATTEVESFIKRAGMQCRKVIGSLQVALVHYGREEHEQKKVEIETQATSALGLQLDKFQKEGLQLRRLYQCLRVRDFVVQYQLVHGAARLPPLLTKEFSLAFITWVQNHLVPYARLRKKTAIYCFECHTIRIARLHGRDQGELYVERLNGTPLELDAAEVFQDYTPDLKVRTNADYDPKTFENPLCAIINFWRFISVAPSHVASNLYSRNFKLPGDSETQVHYYAPRLVIMNSAEFDGVDVKTTRDYKHTCCRNLDHNRMARRLTPSTYAARWLKSPVFAAILKAYFLHYGSQHIPKQLGNLGKRIRRAIASHQLEPQQVSQSEPESDDEAKHDPNAGVALLRSIEDTHDAYNDMDFDPNYHVQHSESFINRSTVNYDQAEQSQNLRPNADTALQIQPQGGDQGSNSVFFPQQGVNNLISRRSPDLSLRSQAHDSTSQTQVHNQATQRPKPAFVDVTDSLLDLLKVSCIRVVFDTKAPVTFDLQANRTATHDSFQVQFGLPSGSTIDDLFQPRSRRSKPASKGKSQQQPDPSALVSPGQSNKARSRSRSQSKVTRFRSTIAQPGQPDDAVFSQPPNKKPKAARRSKDRDPHPEAGQLVNSQQSKPSKKKKAMANELNPGTALIDESQDTRLAEDKPPKANSRSKSAGSNTPKRLDASAENRQNNNNNN